MQRGIRIVICRKSRCLGVMVWSASTAHPTFHESSRNTTPLSFVAFKRLIEGGVDQPENGSELSVRAQILTERTHQ
jgi:hypothetical protein